MEGMNENLNQELFQSPLAIEVLKWTKFSVKEDSDYITLTTFIIPFGRFKLKSLPFGISSAPEVLQKRIRECLRGLNGVVGLMDEFMVYGETEKKHDERLYQVLQRLQDSGCTVNAQK
ncbi:hypothetical protein AVEN_181461-1, partial [Araneus ventricosus]